MDDELFTDAVIPDGQKVDQSTNIQAITIEPAPDSIRTDYVKHQLYKQSKIQDIQTEMIQSSHQDCLQANMQTSILVYKFGGISLILLCVIIFLQFLILRKK